MVRKICLDSDILIELLKNNKSTIEKISSLNAKFYITSINVFELWSGRVEKDGEIIARLINSFDILNFEKNSSIKAGDIRKELSKRRELLEIRDIFIASICIQNNIELFTNNLKHFERLKKFDLKII